MRLLLLLLFWCASAVAQEDVDAQIKRLEVALNRIQAEQQSVYHQFQMVQEQRRSALQQARQEIQIYTPPATPPDYDDVVREKEARDAQIKVYAEELDRLYARYRELEEQKKSLLDQLTALATGR